MLSFTNMFPYEKLLGFPVMKNYFVAYEIKLNGERT